MIELETHGTELSIKSSNKILITYVTKGLAIHSTITITISNLSFDSLIEIIKENYIIDKDELETLVYDLYYSLYRLSFAKLFEPLLFGDSLLP